MIRHYRNNEEGTAIVEHVEMTRAELDKALSVARQEGAAAARERAAYDLPTKRRMAQFEGSEEAFRRVAEKARRGVADGGGQELLALAVWCEEAASEYQYLREEEACRSGVTP